MSFADELFSCRVHTLIVYESIHPRNALCQFIASTLLTIGVMVRSLAEIIQAGKVVTRPGGPRYAYGFNDWDVSGHRIVRHGGGAPGVNTMLQIYPDIGYSVIVLSNFDPPAAERSRPKRANYC
jgi:hypothetical protein